MLCNVINVLGSLASISKRKGLNENVPYFPLPLPPQKKNFVSSYEIRQSAY
jgi:hypothetical protein